MRASDRSSDPQTASELQTVLSPSDLPFVTDGRTVTDADIVNFAGFSGDFGPYHLDHSVARSGVFGAAVLHGLGVLALCSGLVVQSRLLRANGSDPVALLAVNTRMKRATRVGDTVRVIVRRIDQRVSVSRPDCVVCVLQLDCTNQESDVVLQIEWVSLQRRPLLPSLHDQPVGSHSD